MRFKLEEKFSKDIPKVLKDFLQQNNEASKNFINELTNYGYDPSTMKVEEISYKKACTLVHNSKYDSGSKDSFTLCTLYLDENGERDIDYFDEWEEEDKDNHYLKISGKIPTEKIDNRYDINNWKDEMRPSGNYRIPKNSQSDWALWNGRYFDKSGYITTPEIDGEKFSSYVAKYYLNKDPQELIKSLENRITSIETLIKEFLRNADITFSTDRDKIRNYLGDYNDIKEDVEIMIDDLQDLESLSKEEQIKILKDLFLKRETLTKLYYKLYDFYLELRQDKPTDFNW